MKYYVARDANGELFLFNELPERYEGYWWSDDFKSLDESLFPNLKWDDEPIEVEPTLKEVKK